jgi:hypothetical protein
VHCPSCACWYSLLTLAAVWKLFTLFPSSLPSSGSLLGPVQQTQEHRCHRSCRQGLQDGMHVSMEECADALGHYQI